MKRNSASIEAALKGGLAWTASLGQSEQIAVDEKIKALYPGTVKIKVSGVLADQQKNGNGWSLGDNAVDNVVDDINAGKVSLRLDHGIETRSVVGAMTKAQKTGNPGAYKIEYEAELMSADPNVTIPVLKGYVKGISMRAKNPIVKCSACGAKNMLCECEGSHMRIDRLGMVESSVTPDPAYSDGRATLGMTGFSAAMNLFASQFSQSTEGSSMGDDDKKEPTVEELKAAIEKHGFRVEKVDPLADAKAALDAKTKELEAAKAELEKLKAGQQAAPAPSQAPGKPAAASAPASPEKKDEEPSLEAQMKQSPQECFSAAFKMMKEKAGIQG